MQILKDRHMLHQIPEVGLHLPRTAAYLEEELKKLNCRVWQPVHSAVCAWFDMGGGSTLAFRADMDGLPVAEQTGLAFASCHPGRMHACGHDGHMAVLLELARRIAGMKLKKNVLLIFQPGEEGPGGAHILCDTGLLREYKVEAIFGLHLWPGLEKGVLFSRPGAMMSRSCEVTVTVGGKAAHIGKAHLGKDAMAACVEFYTRAAQMEQALDEGIFRLLKFGRMACGSVRNVIAEEATLEGSLRTFDDGVFAQMRDGLHAIARQVEKETGCTVQLHMNEGYPAVYNDPALYEKAAAALPVERLEQPSIITEDFSCYQRHVPGVFFFLGVGDAPALHAADFDFDEAVLMRGADLLTVLAQTL